MGSCSNTHKAQHRFVILTFSQPSMDDQKYIIKDLCCRMQLILSLPYHTSHHCQAPTPSLGYHVDTYFLLDSIIVCHSFNEMFSWSDLSASSCWWAEHRCTSPPRRKLSAVVASFHHSLAPLLPPGGISSSGWQDKQALTSQLTPCCQYYVKYKKDWDWVTAFL